MIHTYKISGMTGDVCRQKVQNALQNIEGVESVKVDVKRGEADIAMNVNIDSRVFKDALKPFPEYQLSEKEVALLSGIYNAASNVAEFLIQHFSIFN